MRYGIAAGSLCLGHGRAVPQELCLLKNDTLYIIENICALKGLKCLGLVVKRARVDAEPAVTDFQDLNS